MKKILISSALILSSSFCYGQAVQKSFEEKQSELIDFKNIQDVLKRDGLEQKAQVKTQTNKSLEAKRIAAEKARFQMPNESDYWNFISEYWLIKRAQILKWDFEKPDYGIEAPFAEFLQKMGHLNKKFSILYTDSPSLAHAALPTRDGETLLILSVPFIRTLDLSKQEICILLFQEYLRAQTGYFKSVVRTEKLKEFLGSNMQGKKWDLSIIQESMNLYDDLLLKKGFNFQNQFEVTTQMNELLKNNLTLWAQYVKILEKIDELVKSNLLYKDYPKIYPSPELQLNWIRPKQRRI